VTVLPFSDFYKLLLLMTCYLLGVLYRVDLKE